MLQDEADAQYDDILCLRELQKAQVKATMRELGKKPCIENARRVYEVKKAKQIAFAPLIFC